MAATTQNLPEQERLRQLFIGAMGAVATGVTVVATGGAGGQFAQTVSAMSSVSADPPLLLVCLNSRSPINAAISANGVLTVTFSDANTITSPTRSPAAPGRVRNRGTSRVVNGWMPHPELHGFQMRSRDSTALSTTSCAPEATWS